MSVTSLLDKSTSLEIRNRIVALPATATPLWGKMNVCQMLEHCVATIETYTGEKKTAKPFFLIQIMGRMLKKSVTKDDKPFSQNSPTSKELKVFTNMEFDVAKETLLKKLDDITSRLERGDLLVDHPFWGKLTIAQNAIINYKHLDHHLRQFGY